MNRMTNAVPTRAATVPEWMASAPRCGATVLSLREAERRRQRTRAQQQRLLLGLLGGEAAGDDAAAATDRALHDRRADDLVVELDGQPLADVGAGGGAEGAAAGGLGGEGGGRAARPHVPGGGR